MCSLVGIRMLDGSVTDSVEAASLSHASDHVDIYSSSWGPSDNGRVVDGPGPMAKRAILDGVTNVGFRSIMFWLVSTVHTYPRPNKENENES